MLHKFSSSYEFSVSFVRFEFKVVLPSKKVMGKVKSSMHSSNVCLLTEILNINNFCIVCLFVA